MLSPDYYYQDVYRIDLDALQAAGIDTLLVDLDNTLLPRNSADIPEATRQWVNEVAARGMHVCLVSNNWHDRVFGVADALGCDLVSKAIKPLPFAFLRALSRANSSRAKAAVVGDQMFTDILGGKVLGIVTVLVTPLTSSDLPHTLLLRRVERVLLAGRQPLP